MASDDTATPPRLWALVFSVAFGLLMVGLAADGSHGLAVAAWAAALGAVAGATVFRPAATLAVLLSVVTIGLSDPPLVFVALSGLCAAAYLVCRHAFGASAAVVMGSWPTAVGAVGFTFAGLVATSFPLQLPWLPLAAPLAALAVYVLAVRPFLS
ncbi:hypothetical protein AWC17_28335 [Mycobacterium nebraskense]|uniref:Integral membrane protein n=2 Tax=Mycobacterium nebraskense TaxID=244292 RepID=A0A1X1ZVG3_9MYCO|nr:membrane protein [Mycobacterium nebraskense]MBI2695465.1 hypothetical protein [Mycobacterium nebraskense]MCV7116642.1 hypothetical protein [Mycobacterium nebraskense]ORW27961.1 hypothetical protein AWC17_28335 [Mycobacterium nebraskense]